MSRRRRKGRSINGILLLNKAHGISSNFALQQVKRLYQAAKAGHTGALDPIATGMLPICLGEATKFSHFLLNSDKGYRVVAKLGQRMDTSDSTGEIIETKPVEVTQKQLMKALDKFRGEISQVPTMFSALKHNGQPLYKLARQGIEVEREARQIHIYSLELIRFEKDEVELNIECSKGTYIRTIVDDLGQLLGCGAHVTELDRTFVADYPTEKMISFDELEKIQINYLQGKENSKENREKLPQDFFDELDTYLLPMDSPILDFQQATLDDDSCNYFCNGNPVVYSGLNPDELVRVYDSQQIFLGIAEINHDGMLAPRRLVVRE
jgi:tRNA pseudouridine55 synthase